MIAVKKPSDSVTSSGRIGVLHTDTLIVVRDGRLAGSDGVRLKSATC
jgi:hypothetical protein